MIWLLPPHQICTTWPSFALKWWRKRRDGCNPFLILTIMSIAMCPIGLITLKKNRSNSWRSASFSALISWGCFGLHLHCSWMESLFCFISLSKWLVVRMWITCISLQRFGSGPWLNKLQMITSCLIRPRENVHLSLPISSKNWKSSKKSMTLF